MQSSHLQRLLSEAVRHLQAGRLDAAARLCAQARQGAGRDGQVLALSGLVAIQQARWAEAAGWLAPAARLQPRSAPVQLRLGFALAQLGRHAESEPPLRAAVTLAPDDAEAWDALGYVLKARGRLEEAIAAHRRSTELKPGRAQSWYNLGLALQFANRPAEALACQERALAANPRQPRVQFGRALALLQSHRIPEAVAAFDAALLADPGHHEARSYRLLALHYLDGWSREDLLAEHLAYGRMVTPASAAPIAPLAGEADRLLRVAFLSADLRDHSVAYFLEPLLAHLDRSAFEVILYHDHFVEDAVSTRLRTHARIWRNFVGQPAEAVEAAIRADAPDIVIDLAGHTGLNRLPLLARRVAPVQVSYLGYPDTTGVSAVDYRFVDAVTDPVEEGDRWHSEALVRFAPTAWSYLPSSSSPDAQARPCLAGRAPVFGCFNNFAKVTDAALAAWARLLARVPAARLRLKAGGLGEAAVADQVRERLVRAGLPLDRVDLIERTPGVAEHLALYHGIDVALDTFPYHGTTTTCEALWMGVPVVTLAGDRHAARVGASLLQAVGFPGWIARSWDDYVRIAAELVEEPAQLAGAGRPLRQAMRCSPLMDHAAQAARFGSALRACWRERCGRAAA